MPCRTRRDREIGSSRERLFSIIGRAREACGERYRQFYLSNMFRNEITVNLIKGPTVGDFDSVDERSKMSCARNERTSRSAERFLYANDGRDGVADQVCFLWEFYCGFIRGYVWDSGNKIGFYAFSGIPNGFISWSASLFLSEQTVCETERCARSKYFGAVNLRNFWAAHKKQFQHNDNVALQFLEPVENT